MVRKVWASQELLRSAGTVTKKLAGWLFEHGYVSADEREDGVEQGGRAARNLPRAERLGSCTSAGGSARSKSPSALPSSLRLDGE